MHSPPYQDVVFPLFPPWTRFLESPQRSSLGEERREKQKNKGKKSNQTMPPPITKLQQLKYFRCPKEIPWKLSTEDKSKEQMQSCCSQQPQH